MAFLPTFPALLGFVSLGYLAAFMALSVQNKVSTQRVVPIQQPAMKYLVPGGLCIGTAYALVIQAMQYLPAAYVVSFTNVGIVIANVLAVTLLNERHAWRSRLCYSLLICLGLVILGLA